MVSLKAMPSISLGCEVIDLVVKVEINVKDGRSNRIK